MENLHELCGQYADLCRETTTLPYELYDEYQVKKGLRDKNGDGVRAGLTNISRIESVGEPGGVPGSGHQCASERGSALPDPGRRL